MHGSKAWLITALAASGLAFQPLADRQLEEGQGYVGGGGGGTGCKCYPGDSCWPSNNEWAVLNRTVGGRLVRAIPPGAACYDSFEGIPTRDPAKCAAVASQWANATWTADQPTIPMIPIWSNNTCAPDTATGSPGPPSGCPDTCTIGFLSQYTILATNADHISAGVNFARTKNLRLIIRNTGHCFMGRSTGYGALVINTHRLNSIQFSPTCALCSDNHAGGTVKVGAGVMFQDLYAQAWPRNLDVLGGECPTVGIAGGYYGGGGQGPLSGYYGVGSDHAVSFDVVLSNGQKTSANRQTNPDLFWALKGGGMGTFGVVTSVTLKTYPVVPVVGMSFTISGSDSDRFWEGIRIWYTLTPTYTSQNMYVWYALQEGGLMATFVAPNKTLAEFNSIISPLINKLTAANITFTTDIRAFSKFGDLYRDMWVTAFHSSGLGAYFGGRQISQTDVKQRGNDIVAAYREMSNKYPGQVLFGGHLVNPGNRIKDPQQRLSAVHPVWRDTADIQVFLYIPPPCMSPEQRTEAERRLTVELGGILRAVTPTSAVYSNEGDVNEPNWQNAFWGPVVYPKVLAIKRKYDPNDVFWSKSSTGSERWALRNHLKLCKV